MVRVGLLVLGAVATVLGVVLVSEAAALIWAGVLVWVGVWLSSEVDDT